MPQYFQNIIELLRNDYPDLSEWTIVCANDRAVESVQFYVHGKIGGILPKIESFHSYMTGKISSMLKLHSVAGDEQLLMFIHHLAEKFQEEQYPARRAAALLPLITKLAEYNLTKRTIAGTERFTEEEWNRFEEYLKITHDFRQWLADQHLFAPELEISQLENILPGEKDIFVGLPALTPLMQRFYRKINKARLFIAPPLFGKELSSLEKLPYDSAKNLLSSFGAQVKYAEGENIELVVLESLPAVVDLVAGEISDFLQQRQNNEQIIIFLLDESLAPLMWRRALRTFGDAVNLAVWLPFSTSAPANRLLSLIEDTQKKGKLPDFREFATACAIELSQKREDYIREECEAFEAAISLATLLDEWKERLGINLFDAAKILVKTKKFHITGSKSAPVQVVGFGHFTGEKFSKGLLVSVDSGIVPSQPFEGPFINPVHVPQLRKITFEYEDLVFRQILSSGKSIKIVAINDPIRERTPSYYLNLLAEEFDRPVVRSVFQEPFFVPQRAETPAIKITESLREKLKEFDYSYSSLEKILSCPFLFYHQHILGLEPPPFMDDEEKIKMQMGDFIHKFLQRLFEGKNKPANWERIFDEMWEEKENAALRNVRGIDIYLLDAKLFLREIWTQEKESGCLLLFGDNVLACEKRFSGIIGGSYKIKGYVDRIQQIGDKIEIIDFKYSRRQARYELSSRTSVLAKFKDKKVIHPAAQLVIYQYYNHAHGARFYFLQETMDDREIKLPEKDIEQAEALLQAIKERLDEIIGGSELLPAYDSEQCLYCRFQLFCGREDYYKVSRRDV